MERPQNKEHFNFELMNKIYRIQKGFAGGHDDTYLTWKYRKLESPNSNS